MNWLNFGKRNRTEPAPQAAEPATEVDKLADCSIGTASGKRILVVDDDAVIQKTTCAKLKSRGYQVVTASDAPEAMSAVREHKPDLILLDICFPRDVGVDWDGLKLLTWLQRMEEAKNIPIIIVSGSEPEKYRERCLATGAAAFFYKPVEYDELLPFVAQVLQGPSGRTATTCSSAN